MAEVLQHYRADSSRTAGYERRPLAGRGRVAWTVATPGDVVTGTPMEIGDVVVFGTSDGRARAVSRDGTHHLWEVELGQGPVYGPAFADGVALVGGQVFASEGG